MAMIGLKSMATLPCSIASIGQGVRAAAEVLNRQNASNLTVLAERPSFWQPQYKGHVTWCARVHMALTPVPRKQHYAVLSELVGRTILSSKELTLSEARAIWNARTLLLTHYRQETDS
jgi:hypothetical protein